MSEVDGTVRTSATLQPWTSMVLIGVGTVTEDVDGGTDVTSITVTGTGGAITIPTDGGMLQMLAAVLPLDATIQTVTWSIIQGTGVGSISSGGLLTAISDGTVTVRATAQDGTGIYDDLIVTFSNQVLDSALLTDILYNFPLLEASGTTVTDDVNSLQGTSTATPTIYGQDFANAGSISIPYATIIPTGDKVSVRVRFKMDVLPSVLTHDVVLLKYAYTPAPWWTIQVSVRASDNKPMFEVANQLAVMYDAIGANDLSVDTWYEIVGICRGNSTKLELYVNGTEVGSATADTFSGTSILDANLPLILGSDWTSPVYPLDGLLSHVVGWDRDITAQEVTYITNQVYPFESTIIPVTSVTVTATGGTAAITVDDGTLQMIATVLPTNATDKTVVWSVVPGTGTASITQTGLLTALTNGTVTVVATPNG